MNARELEYRRQQDGLDLVNSPPSIPVCKHEFLRLEEQGKYRCCQCGKRPMRVGVRKP